MATADLTIVIAGRDEASKVLKGIQNQAGGLGKTLGDVGKIAAGFLAANVIGRGVSAMTGFIGDATQAASSLEQAIGGTEAVFKQNSATIGAWARSAAEDVGLAESEYRTMTTLVGGQLKRMTGDLDFATEQSGELVKAGADLAATYGGTTKEAVEALSAAFRGEADPAERFNLNLKISAVNAKAVELGLASSTTEVSEQARAQALLALITEQSADAQGQFGREMNTSAGRAQIEAAKLENLRAEMGEKLLPVQIFLTKAKTAFVEVLVRRVVPAIEKVAQFIGGVLSPVYSGLRSVVQGVIDVFNGDALESYKLQQGTLRDIVEAVQDVAEFFRDKLIPAVRDTAQAIKDVFSGNPLESYEQHSAGMRKFLQAVEKVAMFVRDKLIPAFKDAAQFIKDEAVPAIRDAIATVLDFVRDQLIPAFESAADFIMNDFGPNFIEGVRVISDFLRDDVWPVVQDVFQRVRDFIVPIVTEIAEHIDEKKALIIVAIAAIGAIFVLTFGAIPLAIAGVIAAIGWLSQNWEEVKAKVTEVADAIHAKIEETFPGITALIVNTFEAAKAVVTSWVETVITVITAVVSFISEHWGEIKTVFMVVLDDVTTRLEGFYEVIRGVIEIVSGVVTTVKAIFEGDWQAAWDGMKLAAEGVLSLLEGVVKTTFGNIPGIISGLARDAATAAYEWGREIFNSAKAWFEQLPDKLWQAGVDAINGLINGLKSIDVGSVAAEIANDLTFGITGKLGIKSPSTVMHGYGQDTMQGFINGLEAKVPALQNTLRAVTDLVTGFGGSLANQAYMTNVLASNPGAGVLVPQTRTSEFGTITAKQAAEFLVGGFGKGLAGVSKTILDTTGMLVGSFEDLQAFIGTSLPGSGSSALISAVSGVQNIMETVFTNFIGQGFTAWQATVSAHLAVLATQMTKPLRLEGFGDVVDEITKFTRKIGSQVETLYNVNVGNASPSTGGAVILTAAELEARGIPSFDSGGVVPGRRGSRQLIMAHGGETVLPTHRGESMGVVINVTGNNFYGSLDSAMENSIKRVVRDAILGGGFRGVLGTA